MNEDELARLRVAVETGHLPRDLGLLALRELTPSAERRRRRDVLIRRAAASMDGSRWARARRIHESLSRLRANPDMAEHEPLAEAFHLDPATPASVRHLLDILK